MFSQRALVPSSVSRSAQLGMNRIVALAFTLLLLHAAHATPLALRRRQAITTLSASQVASFKKFTIYASAVYCQPSTIRTWTCGANCEANAGFIPTAAGGDGTDTQFWYVGFDPSLNTIVVAHEGTNTSSLVSELSDIDIIRRPLDSNLFPGVPSSVEAHEGFARQQANSANDVLSAVQTTLSAHPSASVSVVGHSLGGAIALLDGVFLPLHLPAGTTIKTIVYGTPRVGNQEFADYVDAHVTSLNDGTGLTRINNKEDIVPILPGRFLGFHHPSGEVHIQDSGAWDACPGQDNTSDLCTTGDVPNIFEGTPSDHTGPYDGILMGC